MRPHVIHGTEMTLDDVKAALGNREFGIARFSRHPDLVYYRVIPEGYAMLRTYDDLDFYILTPDPLMSNGMRCRYYPDDPRMHEYFPDQIMEELL